MKTPLLDLVIALAIPAVAALGGALYVFGEFDDAPGGMQLGLVLAAAAAVVNVREARRGA